MVRNVGVHGANDAHVVNALAQVWKKFADFGAAATVLLEAERRLHQPARLPLMLWRFSRQRFAVVLLQHWLGIESVHLGHATIHE